MPASAYQATSLAHDPERSRSAGRAQHRGAQPPDAHTFLPEMLVRGRGGIINVASLGGFTPGPYQAAYYASKAYVISLTRALAHENRGMGVRFATVAPWASRDPLPCPHGRGTRVLSSLFAVTEPCPCRQSDDVLVCSQALRSSFPELFNAALALALGFLPGLADHSSCSVSAAPKVCCIQGTSNVTLEAKTDEQWSDYLCRRGGRCRPLPGRRPKKPILIVLHQANIRHLRTSAAPSPVKAIRWTFASRALAMRYRTRWRITMAP